jgi:hypothetical protein
LWIFLPDHLEFLDDILRASPAQTLLFVIKLFVDTITAVGACKRAAPACNNRITNTFFLAYKAFPFEINKFFFCQCFKPAINSYEMILTGIIRQRDDIQVCFQGPYRVPVHFTIRFSPDVQDI